MPRFFNIIGGVLLVLMLISRLETLEAKDKKRSGKSKTDELSCEACKALAVEVGPKVKMLEKRMGRGNSRMHAYECSYALLRRAVSGYCQHRAWFTWHAWLFCVFL